MWYVSGIKWINKDTPTYDIKLSKSKDGIKCNITAVLTVDQVKEIYQVADPKTETIISIFAGRIADTGIDPIQTMRDAINLCKPKKTIEIFVIANPDF